MSTSPSAEIIAAQELGCRITETINTVAGLQIATQGQRLNTGLHQNFAKVIESSSIVGPYKPTAERLLGTLLSGVNTVLVPEVDDFISTPLIEIEASKPAQDFTGRMGDVRRVPELCLTGLREDIVTHSIMVAAQAVVLSALFAPIGQRIINRESTIYMSLGHDAPEIYRGDKTSLGLDETTAEQRKIESLEDLQRFKDEFTLGIQDFEFPFPLHTLTYEEGATIEASIIKIADKAPPSQSHHFNNGLVLRRHYRYLRPEQYVAGFNNTDHKLAEPQYQSLTFWIAYLLEARSAAISSVYKVNIDNAREAVHAAACRNGLIDA